MKKRLYLALLLPIITSCQSNYIGCPSFDLPFNSKTIEKNEINKDEIVTYDYDTLYEDGYHKLFDGLYVNYLPGIYSNSLKLDFKIASGNGKLFYSINDGSCDVQSIYAYNGDKIDIKAERLSLDKYPLTTSVDAINTSSGTNRCYSYNYIDNIQNTGDYYLSKHQNIITIKYVNRGQVYSTSLTYIIDDEDLNIPVVSLSVKYDDLFGENDLYNDLFAEKEARAYMEYIDPEYNEYYAVNTKIKLGGNWSKGYPQRTLNLNFNKDENGKKNKKLTAHVFKEDSKKGYSNERLSNLTRLRLHNGGNNFESDTGFNDALLHQIMMGTNCAVSDYRPCIAYINGEYWGIYSLREHYADVYFEDNYNVNKDDVIVYEYYGGWKFDDGNENYAAGCIDELNNYLKNNFASNQVYQTFIDNYIDVDSLIDLFIAESYACNWDFVGNYNNLKMWKTTTKKNDGSYYDGKWRFCMHDVDFAFTSNENYLDPNVANSYNLFPIFSKLMENDQFKTRFYNRAVELLGSNLSAANCKAILNGMANEIKPYKNEHGKRWGQPSSYYNTWLNNVTNTLNYFDNRSANYLSQLQNTLNKY